MAESDLEMVTMAANMNADTIAEQQKEIRKLSAELARLRRREPERFNDIGPFCIDGAPTAIEIERNEEKYQMHLGQLWTGGAWLTVAQAREFRVWLDKVIP